MTGFVLGQPEAPRRRLSVRFGIFGLVVVLVVGLLTTRLFYLQVVEGGYYAGLAEQNRQLTLPIRSARGLVYDRAGRPLAINIPSYVVRVRPARPALQPTTGGRRTAVDAARHSNDRHHRGARPLRQPPVRAGAHRVRRVQRRGPHHRRGKPQSARRRGGRRGAPRVRLRGVGVASAGLRRAGHRRRPGRARPTSAI